MGRAVFDLARFAEGCFEALEADRPVETIRDLLTVTVSLIEGLPYPDPRLTIIQVTVARGLQNPAHNHGMEAARSSLATAAPTQICG